MVLELLEGESLEQRLYRTPVLPHGMVAGIITQVARALTRAHEAGLIHRDLKPSNIFLVRNDEEEIAKVLDFGLVKASNASLPVGQSDLTGVRVVGTPYYMSPEQAQGKAVDHRTDLWALAVVAFECVCGALPFQDDIPTQLLLQICVKPLPVPSRIAPVPPGFDEWFLKATERDPARRFQSAREMAEALRAVLAPGESTGRYSLQGEIAVQAGTGPLARVADPLADSSDKATVMMSRDTSPAFFRTQRRLAVTLLALLAAAAAGAVFLVSLLSGPPEVSPAADPPEASAASAAAPEFAPRPAPAPAPEVPSAAAAPPEALDSTQPAPSGPPSSGGTKRVVDPRLGF
jgi:serine/threonine-protein kinase